MRLLAAVANMSHRKCRDCGNVAYHLDAITPYVLCETCGSQDTRLIRTAAPDDVPAVTAAATPPGDGAATTATPRGSGEHVEGIDNGEDAGSSRR